MGRPTIKRATALWGLAVVTLFGVIGIGGTLVYRLHHSERPPIAQGAGRAEPSAAPDRRSDDALRLAGSGSNIPLMRALVAAFAAAGPGPPMVVHRSIGSTGGIRALRDGVIDLAMVTTRGYRDALIVFALFGVLGVVLGWLTYQLPVRAAHRAERMIGGLVGRLRRAPAALTEVNEDLERRVVLPRDFLGSDRGDPPVDSAGEPAKDALVTALRIRRRSDGLLPAVALLLLLVAPRVAEAAELGDGEPSAPPNDGSAEPPTASAEEALGDGLEPPAALEPLDVVVTGKRSSEDPFAADRPVSLVGPKELREMQPRTIPEALWDTPGVFVQQTNYGGGSPIVHGLVGPQVLLMFDGVRLNNSVYRTGPLQYLNLIDSLSLSRLEVLRGPGSVLYGSDAMGGVIQMFPHAPRDSRHMKSPEVHGSAQVRYASASKTVGSHGHAELGVQGFGAMAGASLQSLGDLRGGQGVGVQPHSGYGDHTALGSLDYRFGEGALAGWRNKGTYLYSRLDRAGRTDALYTQQSLRLYDNELHLVYDRAHLEVAALSTTIDLTPSFQRFFERVDRIGLADDLTTRQETQRDETAVHTFGIDGQLETSFIEDRLGLRYGAMFYRDWVEARRLERDGWGDWVVQRAQSYPSDSSYQHFGVFALLHGAPVASAGGHRLQLRGGYRLHGMDGSAPAQPGLPEVDYAYLGHVFMGAIQYLYEDRATAAFTFAQGFRAPNLQEAVMLGDSGSQFHIPNPDLKPERSNTFELLGRGRGGPLTLSWVGYLSLLDDLLVRENTSYQGQTEIAGDPVRRHINANAGLLWGTEGGLGLDLGAGFSAHGQVTYTWGESELPDGTTEPLSRIPPLFGTAKVRYDRPLPRRWRGFVETYVRWALTQDRLSERDEEDSRIPDGGTPEWWTWNLRAGLADDGHHRVAFGVENLLDRRYKYHGSGLYAPGLSAMVSYEAGF